ncbi:uncharacterized protein LOC120352266 [Nilaparvata lugens]|uniref:uncharacterized protein LOC120352230 n=1 Tax=Nilaparvata lugens TaxID=108931 RepID=UPI00193D90BD|nr:uncharacterized protein LOC120352230 [Nilaparvata lugens]XP_039287971.1 uncharacterized protein LOC120352266 [Nilaparvata lugens]
MTQPAQASQFDLMYNRWFSVQGPYEQRPLGSEHCRFTGRSCMEGNFTRRKLPGKDKDWHYNVTLRNYMYMKDTTTMRIVASTKGASGHYNSLADITRPACKWLEWIKPFVNDLSEHAGYNPKDICSYIMPGWFQITNFHVKAQSHFRISQIPIAPYGSYKFEFHLSEKDNPSCHCMRVFMDIIPDAKTILRKQSKDVIFMIMKKNIIFTNYFAILLSVRADLLDDYVGPYQRTPTVTEYCRINGNSRSCLNCNFTMRQLPNQDWLFNVTLRNYMYLKDTTNLRLIASMKGANGQYNSLAEITRPTCQLLEWIKPLINDLATHAGYNPKDICLAAVPGLAILCDPIELSQFGIK